MDTFTYTITDGKGNFDTATVTVTVNDPPDAVNNTTTTDEDTPVKINVLVNDTDSENNPLTVTATPNKPSNGNVVINGDGTITYTPNKDFNGLDTFTYTISDGKGGTDTATVTININPVNDPPDAVNDKATTQEEVAIDISVLTNDTDIENNKLTVTTVTNGSNGLTSINPDETVKYTPIKDFFGVDTFTYTISDGNGGNDTATVTVTVTNIQDAPDAKDDAVTTFEDTQISFTVISNDLEYDKDPLSVSNFTKTSNGTLSFNSGTQRFTYNPNQDFVGIDTFIYEASDGQGGFDTATVTITVQQINDAPDAKNDSITINEDIVTDINVLNNDIEVDGDTKTVTAVTTPQNGTASINPDGTIKYTPKANFFGSDTFTYTITDGKGLFDTATISVTILPINDNPVATVDSRITFEEVPLKISVLANDTDVDKDTLTLLSFGTATNGTLSASGNVITYTPNKDFVGIDNFTYIVSDGKGGTATGNVSVNVLQVNDNPTANKDNVITDEDKALSISVLANDNDVDGDTVKINSSSNGSKGNTTVNPDGTITYTPKANLNGIDTFTYTISDGKGGFATTTVTVNITPVQDVPDAINDGFNVNNGTVSLDGSPININVLANDNDVDGDLLTVVSIPTSPINGTASINPDGTIKYSPSGSFTGTETFTYQITDGQGNFDTATVTVSVRTSNSGQASTSDKATTNEDSAVIIDVLANDIDPEGDKLSILYVSDPAKGSAVANPDGTITYTPDANFNGVDSFTYRTSDGKGNYVNQNVIVTVLPLPDPPDAVNDNFTVNEDSSTILNILNNDSDPDGDKVSLDSIITGVSNGNLVVNPDGTVTYTPKADFFGSDSFTYKVTDGNGNFDTATATITIVNVQDSPKAVNDNATGDEDNVITFNILSNDTELDGDAYFISSYSSASKGSLSIDSVGSVTYIPEKDFFGVDTFTYSISDAKGLTSIATVSITVNPINDAPEALTDFVSIDEDSSLKFDARINDTDIESDKLSVFSTSSPTNGSVFVNPDGTLTYTPKANYHGKDSFTYTISDGNGGNSTATVNIIVTPINDNPVGVNDTQTTQEENLVTISVLSNDSDVDGDSLVVTNLGQPSNGNVTLNADKTITYTPDKNFNGVDIFNYTINDGKGGSAVATVTVNVTNTDDPLDAINDTATTNEDAPIKISVLANDNTFGDPDILTITATSSPTNGSVTINPDGTISYTPTSNFFGSDSFTYTVNDGNGNSDTATVSITILAVQDPPDAVNDSASASTATPTVINVLSNDSDPDTGDILQITGVTQGSSGGIVSFSFNNVTYTSQGAFTGTETFTYTITDGNGNNDTATVTMSVI